MNKTSLILAAIAAAFAYTSIYFWQHLQTAQAQIKAMQGSAINSAHVPATAAAMNSTSTAESLSGSSAPANAPAATAAAAETAAPRNAGDERNRQALKNPEYRAATMAQLKTGLRSQYADLQYWVAMPRDMADKFLDLKVEQRMRGVDEVVESPAQPVDENDPQWIRKQEELQQQHEQELKDFLGPEKFAQLTDYEESAGARGEVREMQLTLDMVEPLREDQFKPLAVALRKVQQDVTDEIKILSAATSNAPGEEAARAAKELELYAKAIELERQASTPLLSPRQKKAMDELLDQKLEGFRASAKMQQVGQQLETEQPAPGK